MRDGKISGMTDILSPNCTLSFANEELTEEVGEGSNHTTKAQKQILVLKIHLDFQHYIAGTLFEYLNCLYNNPR